MENKENYDFKHIFSQFAARSSLKDVRPFRSGHIHDTYHVVSTGDNMPDYLLQRVNSHVFQDIPALMNNIRIVTGHIRKKMEKMPGCDPDKEVLTLIPTKNGEGYFQDSEGNIWRLYYFIENTRSHDIVQTLEQAFEGGKAFGRFLSLLSDLDSGRLKDTIPHFHDIENRFRLFRNAIERNPKDRVKEVGAEIQFAFDREEAMATINRRGRQGLLPLRTTHNDTKFNNVLLDDQNKAQCVVDLDTVMPGYVAFDFGDATRTIVNTALEDERDLGKVGLNMELFEGFTKGFLKETIGFLTDSEIESLSQGALLLPFIMGLRFLTDYIDGDHYYKIAYPGHNLQRARVQFKLVGMLEERFDEVRSIIENAVKYFQEKR